MLLPAAWLVFVVAACMPLLLSLPLPPCPPLRGLSRVNSNVQSAVSALSCTSSAFGSAGGTGAEINGVRVDEASVRRALEEEAAAMNQLKVGAWHHWLSSLLSSSAGLTVALQK